MLGAGRRWNRKFFCVQHTGSNRLVNSNVFCLTCLTVVLRRTEYFFRVTFLLYTDHQSLYYGSFLSSSLLNSCFNTPLTSPTPALRNGISSGRTTGILLYLWLYKTSVRCSRTCHKIFGIYTGGLDSATQAK